MPSPWPRSEPTSAERAAYADATPRSFWLDSLPPREPHAALAGRLEADLCIVGGGYTGLWAALQARSRDPERDVVLLEATRCGDGASGRNGGFVSSSLTHGIANGARRYPREIDRLEQLGARNFAALQGDLARFAIECDFEANGELTVALSAAELAELDGEAALLRRFGHDVELLDGELTRAQLDSPTYRGGLWDRTGAALVNPGLLADGLRRAAAGAGVLICEQSEARDVAPAGAGLRVATAGGSVDARRVLLATSAYPPLVPAIRRYVAPVYDYVLVTEVLSPAQRDSLGWRSRQGVGDSGNLFHYYRPTGDGRILWGGYDAVYRFGGPVGPANDVHDATFARLSQHFFWTFPQLAGLRFSHRWGGAIDTCSRFAVFFGTALEGRLAWALGYTGLGVAASRFGAEVALDLLDGRDSELTDLEFVRRRPVPFPPEPLRSAVIQLTRNRLAAADRHDGRRGVWLKALDTVGLGFDS